MATVATATRRHAGLPLLAAQPGEQPEQESKREAAAAPSPSCGEITSTLCSRRSVAVGGGRRERQKMTTGVIGVERRIALGVTALGFCLLVGLASAHTTHMSGASHAPGYGTAARSAPGEAYYPSSATAASSGAAQGQQAGSGASLAPVTPVTPVTNPPVPATTPSPATPATGPAPQSGGDGFSLDPKQWVVDALGAAFSWIVSGITSALTDLLKQALNLDILVFTPPGDTYQNGVVLTFWRTLVAVADGALALIVCWAGYNSIVRHAVGARYHDAMQVIPRVALAGLAINLSLLLTQTLIDLNNALCGVVSDPFARILGLLALNGSSATAGVAFFILFLAFGIVGLLLVVQMVVRLAMLDVLIVTAPLGLVCWVLPQTQPWAQLWTRAFISTVFVQFLQVLALTLGGALIAFFPSDGLFAALMDLIIGLATLYLTLKIPSFLRSLGGPAAPNPLNDAAGVAGTALMVARTAAIAATL